MLKYFQINQYEVSISTFADREITTNVENLSPLKLSLFKELANSKPIKINDNGLNKGSDGWSGSLIIDYEND